MAGRFLILGAPRSGTSMVAGLFASAGIHVGDELLAPTISNPAGYFESRPINTVNSHLIGQLVKWPRGLERVRRRIDLRVNLDPRAYPFASPRFLRCIDPDRATLAQLRDHAARDSFCYKDPRFCVTLPTWRRVLPADTRFVVVFREPTKTIQSYIKNGRDVYDPPLTLPMDELSIAYSRNYERLLQWASDAWCFLHYDQICSGEGLERLSRWVRLPLPVHTINPHLRRSTGGGSIKASPAAWKTYRTMCARAGHHDQASWTAAAE